MSDFKVISEGGHDSSWNYCQNYATMLREINERGERIKKLGWEVEKAYNEAWFDHSNTVLSLRQAWKLSRAKRISEGLE